MRSINFVLATIAFGLLFGLYPLCLGQNLDSSYNASSVEPPSSGQPLQLSNESVPYVSVNSNMLWLDDQNKIYSRMFCTSLVKGGWAKAEVVSAATGNLTIYRKSFSGNANSKDMGSVQAGKQYDLWVHINDDTWYNDLWYSVNGKESNHVWIYMYNNSSSQYLGQ